MKFHVENRFTQAAYAIYAYREIEGRGREFWMSGDPWERKIVDPDSAVFDTEIRPLFVIPYNDAPALLSALQQAGVRPPELSMVDGQLQAQTEHLRDLQKILRKQNIMEG